MSPVATGDKGVALDPLKKLFSKSFLRIFKNFEKGFARYG